MSYVFVKDRDMSNTFEFHLIAPRVIVKTSKAVWNLEDIFIIFMETAFFLWKIFLHYWKG